MGADKERPGETMTDPRERIKDMIFELGDMKAKARTSEDYELADASLAVLRAKWEKFCQGKMVAKEIKAA